MESCITAAYWFLVKGMTLEKVLARLGKDVSKQRAAQYVAKGCRFLLDRRYIRKA